MEQLQEDKEPFIVKKKKWNRKKKKTNMMTKCEVISQQ